MSDKSNAWIKFFRLFHWIPILLFSALPLHSFCQLNRYNASTQSLLLKMGSCYLNVAKQNQIDIDSGLALASQRTHLNPMPVIAEGEDGFSNVSEAKKLVASSVGLSQLKLMNLIGAWYVFQPAGRKGDLDSAMAWLGKVRKGLEHVGNFKLLVRNLSQPSKR